MALSETLKTFCSIFGRNGFDLGEVSFNENETNRNQLEELDLNGQIKKFYSLIDFKKLVISGALFLKIFSSDDLSRAQNGWRWIIDSSGQTVEDTANWNENWIVFGDRNGDAIYVKNDDPLSPVFGTIQKIEHFQLADSLETFFKIINKCLVIEEKEFDFETQTADLETDPKFLERVTEVVKKLAPENEDDFIQFFFD